MDKSIFEDKNKIPTINDLEKGIDSTFYIWKNIVDYVYEKYPNAIEEWNFAGIKYGWSFRIKDKKRAIIYLLPRHHFFKVAFVFGQKATDIILQSKISNEIKTELEAARVYAEGRGIRIDIKNETIINDIKELIDIKISH